ncbi:MAG: hypothetical protein QOK05_680 [Chloroflexota bacterium]|jgi:uncharacterized protein (DUF58 family)|nr:hypothetical protein [Chloroflexota bacterium]
MAVQGLTAVPVASAPSQGILAWIERNVGVTLSGILVVVISFGGWLLAHALGGRAMYLLAYCLLAMLGASIYIARRKRPVAATRSELARRARVGQTLVVNLVLTSERRIATFRLEEKLHPHLGPTVIVPVASVAPGQEIEHNYSFTPRLRGVYKIGPLTAEFSDPLGLAKRHQQLIGEAEIIVHPNVEQVLDRPLTRAFEDPPLRPPNSRAWPEGFEFYGMRDYVRGDDMRRVVWRAFARTGKLLVREFEQGISDRIAIVVDTDEQWHSPGVPSETFETAVRVAASVGVRHIKDGFNVRVLANYGDLGAGFRGPRARLTYLDHMARLRLGKEPLSAALETLVRGSRRDSHVVLVTSRFDAESAARANLMIAGGASFTVCAIIWEESDPVTLRRAREIGAQVVQVKPGASITGVFRASLQTNLR